MNNNLCQLIFTVFLTFIFSLPNLFSQAVTLDITHVNYYNNSYGSVTVLIDDGIVDLPVTAELHFNGSLLSSNIYSVTEFTYNNLEIGTYTLLISDDRGCVSELDFNIENCIRYRSSATNIVYTICTLGDFGLTRRGIDRFNEQFIYREELSKFDTLHFSIIVPPQFTMTDSLLFYTSYNLVKEVDYILLGNESEIRKDTTISSKTFVSEYDTTTGGLNWIYYSFIQGDTTKLNNQLFEIDSTFFNELFDTNYEEELSIKITVWPNPADEIINLKIQNLDKDNQSYLKILLYNSNGQIVNNINKNYSGRVSNDLIRVSSLMTGVYYLVVINNENNKILGHKKITII